MSTPSRSLLITAFALAFLCGTQAAWSAPAPATEATPEVQKELEVAVRARVAAIASEKNQQGQAYKRAISSRSFQKVDDSTYQVGLHVDTANGQEQVTERYLLTLKNKGGDWVIDKEELQDTYKGLFRGVLGDEDCMHFDQFTLEREGLKTKATNGSLCKDYFQGRVSRFSLAAADLSFEYVPPMPKEKTLNGVLRKDKAPDLAFKPDYGFVFCDPVSCDEILTTAFQGLKPIKREEADKPLLENYDKWSKESEKALAENPFWGFRRPYDPARRTYTIGMNQKRGPDDYRLSLDYDNFEPKEVSLWLTGYGFGPLYRYYSEATRKSSTSPYDLERRLDPGSRDYELVSLKGSVELGFGDGETLVGDITYGIKTLRPLRELPFSIARIFQTDEKKERKNPKMTINSMQDGEGHEITWVRTGLSSGLVVLPKEAPQGAVVALRLQFVNTDNIYKLTPSFSYVDRAGWLPFVRFADFIDEFDLTVRVPAKYKTLGIGQKVSETKEGGVATTRWVSNAPVSFPSLTFGDYYEAKSSIKATKADGTEIPVVIHVDRQSLGEEIRAVTGVHEDTEGNVTGTVATTKVSQRAAQDFVDTAAGAINLYTKIFGVDYPFAKLDLVNDPLGGFYGQAPSSLIYLGNPDFYSKGFMSGAMEQGGLSTFQDSVVPHEVAHQWWGSLVDNLNEGNYWFVESLAEYSSALYTEQAYGKKKYFEHVEAWRKEILEADMRESVQDGYTVWGGPDGFRSYRAAHYAKGPYAFHIMRSIWGDEAFFKFLKALATDLKGKQIVTRDIQMVAEKSFGANLDWFFDQWIRGVGLPQFTFNYTVREAEDGSQVIEGDVVQKLAMRPATAVKEVLAGQFFKGIIPITVIGKSGKEYRKRLIIEGEKTSFKFNVPEKPKEIIFNKYGESLGYDTVVNASS